MTVAAAELRQHFEHENQLWKQGDHHLQARVRDAYNAWFRAQCAEGNPPDALVRRSGNETERFMERAIVGLDGHSYWDNNSMRFRRNDGSERNPRLWWWEHIHGPLEKRATVKPVCGDPHCITPEHQAMQLWSEAKRQYTDQQCAGALQVAALRLGHTPTMAEYVSLGLVPTSKAIHMRFSSWDRAVEAAGLAPVTRRTGYRQTWTDGELLDSLRSFAAENGRVPKGIEWDRLRLRPNGRTISRRFGGWHVALVRAGLR